MTAADTATLRVEIASDRNSAELIIPGGFPVHALTPDACAVALQAAGVVVNDEVLGECAALIQQATTQETRRDCRGVVARSRPPMHGVPGRIEWLVDEAKSQAEFSHYDRSAFLMVKQGQEVARIIEPIAAQDGCDVTGRVISAKEGKPFNLRTDETLLVNSKSMLIAQAEGALDRNDALLRVRNVLQVPEYVDFSTGNIDFSGDVLIRKGVRDCFIVRAGGSIHCDGVIEAATIECVGDLVTRGMAGRDRGTAATGGKLVARYLDNFCVRVGGDLHVEKSIVNCDTTVFGSLDAPHAGLIGGRHTVTGPVRINTLGSPANVVTELIIGTVPRLDPFHDQLVVLLKQLEERQAKLSEENNHIHNSPHPTATQKERLTELCFEMTRCGDGIARAIETLRRLNARISQSRTVHVTINHVLHMGVTINIGGQHFRIREDIKGPLTIERDASGQAIIRSGDVIRGPLGLIAELKAAA